MSVAAPDTTGYPLARAREMLSAAGVEVTAVQWVGRAERRDDGRRMMVIRQRPGADGGVELTAAAQWRTPIHDDG